MVSEADAGEELPPEEPEVVVTEDSDTAPLLGNEADEKKQACSLDDAIEALGFGPFQYRALVAVSLLWISIAMQWMVLPYLLLRVKKEWHISTGMSSLLGSSGIIGLIVGGPLFGTLSDAFGRKPSMLVSAFLMSLGTALGPLSPGPIMLCVTRFIMGVGTNAALMVSNTLICEILPTGQRGRWLSFLHLTWQLGALVCIALSVTISDWRLLLLVLTIPGKSSLTPPSHAVSSHMPP